MLVSISRRFKKGDYDQALDLTVGLGDCLPPEHLVRFVCPGHVLKRKQAMYTV